MLKKAQSAIEFLIIVSFLLFFFTSFFLVLSENINTKSKENINQKVTNLAYTIQQEIILAHESTDGYNRVFKIPEDIEGLKYEITMTKNQIYIKSYDNKYAITVPILNTTGTLIKGNNNITKHVLLQRMWFHLSIFPNN